MSGKRVSWVSPIIQTLGMLTAVTLIFILGSRTATNANNEKMFNETFYGIGVENHLNLYPPGLIVSEVYPGTPAEKAGMQKFDVILSVNSADATFDRLKAIAESETAVYLEIRRGGRIFDLSVTPELMKRKLILVPVQ